jgi:hypothetical protein
MGFFFLEVFATAMQRRRDAYFTTQGLFQCHDCMVIHAHLRCMASPAEGTPNAQLQEDINLFMRAIHFATLVK